MPEIAAHALALGEYDKQYGLRLQAVIDGRIELSTYRDFVMMHYPNVIRHAAHLAVAATELADRILLAS